MSKVVTFGEIMLRLSTPGNLRFAQARQFDATFGGGEANVAVSLANYGIDAEFITRLPDNDLAHSCVRDLRSYGVGTDGIVWGGDRLGIYFLETGAVSRPSKVVYDRAGSSIATVKPGMIDWDKALDGADWFHWTGITPAISQGAADVCLEAIRTAEKGGEAGLAAVSFDWTAVEQKKTYELVLADGTTKTASLNVERGILTIDGVEYQETLDKFSGSASPRERVQTMATPIRQHR